jgi:hypothetical protein
VTPFDFAAERLEAATSFSRLEARGTLRLALREAGLDHTAGSGELVVVLRRVLPRELGARGVASGDSVCEGIARAVSQQPFDAPRAETAVEVFRRLGGG